MPLNATEKSHQLATLGYLLLFLGFLFGISALIGLLINHNNFAQSKNTYLRSHLILQLVTTWVLLVIVLATVLTWSSTLAKTLLVTGFFCWLSALLAGTYYLYGKREVPLFKNQSAL